MIRLKKGEEPALLKAKGAEWTAELLDKLEKNEDVSKYLLSRYSSKEIKSALVLETSGKCAYCESAFGHVTYGDVEHIIPKSQDPSLRFDWRNLTIACDICNTKKSNRVGLVDPYESYPEQLFEFHGTLMWAFPGSDAAQLTEEVLDLNRPGLLERRRERLEYIRRLVDSAMAKSSDVKEAILERAVLEIGDDKPFSACARSIFPDLNRMYGVVAAR